MTSNNWMMSTELQSMRKEAAMAYIKAWRC